MHPLNPLSGNAPWCTLLCHFTLSNTRWFYSVKERVLPRLGLIPCSPRSTPRFDIALPLHTAKYGRTSFETLPFIAIAESIGIAVLKHSNVPSGKLMSSLVQAWPVLLFIILTASIAGVVIWFVVRELIMFVSMCWKYVVFVHGMTSTGL